MLSLFEIAPRRSWTGRGLPEDLMLRISVLIPLLAIGLAGLFAAGQRLDTIANEDQYGAPAPGGHPVVGAWVWEADTAEPAAAPTYSLFHADGTYLEVHPLFGVGIGVWAATGERTADLTVVFQDIDLASAGAAPGTLTVRAAVAADATGNALTARVAITERGPEGAVQFADDFMAMASRLTVEPLVPLGTPIAGIHSGREAGAEFEVEDNRYMSPTYGFTVEWDPSEWQPNLSRILVNEGSFHRDRLALDSGAGSLWILGFVGFDGDFVECITHEVARVPTWDGVSNVMLMKDQDGQAVIRYQDDRAFATLTSTFTDDAGSSFEEVRYIECRELVPGKAVLYVHFLTDPDEYDCQIGLVQEVLDTIVVPDTSKGAEEPDSTPMVRDAPLPGGEAASTVSAAEATAISDETQLLRSPAEC